MNRILLVVFLILSLNFRASAIYDVNDNCKDAWMLLMDLNFDKAKQILETEIQTNPENYYAYYLDQTCDAYKLMINSNDADFDEFFSKHENRREIMDGKDEDLPYYLSCKSEMDLHVGIFKIIKGSRLSGLRKAYSAYSNTYLNLEKFPDFIPSLKLDGFFNVAVDNLPPFVKWAVSAFGVTGNADYGFKVLIENYETLKQIKGLNAEAALYYILSAKLNKTPEMVYKFVDSLDSSIAKTFIHSYFRVNIYHRTAHNEKAITSLNIIDISKKPEGEIIYSYLKGKVLLRKLDDSAGYYLNLYLSNVKKEEYLKEVNYQMALYYLVNNQIEKFEMHKEIADTKGVDVNERDREALYDASLDYTPNVKLTKASLLLDGGYFERCQSTIKTYEESKTEFLPYTLEYHFLNGKYFESIGQTHLAIRHFNNVIEKGSAEDYYFAADAARHLGDIYRKLDQLNKAKKYYEKSIELYSSNYYEYIEDKAAKALRDLED